MYFIYFAVPALFMIPVGIYLFYYLRRAAESCHMNIERRAAKAALIILSVVLVIPAVNIWGFWAVVILHWFGFALCMEILNGIVRKVQERSKKNMWNLIYRSGLVPVLAAAVVLGYGYWNMGNIVETDYTVETQKAIRSEGYRIAMISDLHFGTTMGKEKLKEYCLRIGETAPDMVVLCGDIVDEKTTIGEMQEAFETLSSISSPLGIFYVYGNHDQSHYSSDPYFTAAELEETIRSNGIQILEDETVQVTEDMAIAGRKDRSSYLLDGRVDAGTLLGNTDKDDFLILADHQPVELEENRRAGYDLQISGHTHGGQIWPVGLICDVLGFGEVNYGALKMDSMQVIVSSGIAGWGYPVRTGHHSEYVIVDIVPGE